MISCKIKREWKSGKLSVLTLFIAGMLLTTAPFSAWAAHLGGTTGHPAFPTIATEDVRNTIHNLGDNISGLNNPNIVSTLIEVCVFCHTPHGSNPGAPGSAPLWNRQIGTGASYTMYNSPNFDNFPAPGGGPVGVSLACLSCHDGTFALDALINVGGSGLFFGYTPPSSDTVNPEGVNDLIDGGGSMVDALRTDTGPNYGAILTGALPFPNLGVDLTDDHPISIPLQNLASLDPQFDAATATDDGNITRITRAPATVSDKRDAVRLYPPLGGNVNGGDKQDYVECASCHNPHAPRPLFLRLPASVDTGVGITSATLVPASWGGLGTLRWSENPNQGSAVCLTCHEK